MCNIYSGTDPALYETVTRSVRVNGVVTSLRLEQRFWQILDEIALKEGCSTPQFLGMLHNEVMAQRDTIPNFASLLRVVCTVYLQQPEAALLPVTPRAGITDSPNRTIAG